MLCVINTYSLSLTLHETTRSWAWFKNFLFPGEWVVVSQGSSTVGDDPVSNGQNDQTSLLSAGKEEEEESPKDEVSLKKAPNVLLSPFRKIGKRRDSSQEEGIGTINIDHLACSDRFTCLKHTQRNGAKCLFNGCSFWLFVKPTLIFLFLLKWITLYWLNRLIMLYSFPGVLFVSFPIFDLRVVSFFREMAFSSLFVALLKIKPSPFWIP